MEWRLIDSAPKDGTLILAFGRTMGQTVQAVLHWREVWFDKEESAGDGLYRKVRTFSHGDWRPSFNDFEPTHWQPLPEPPK